MVLNRTVISAGVVVILLVGAGGTEPTVLPDVEAWFMHRLIAAALEIDLFQLPGLKRTRVGSIATTLFVNGPYAPEGAPLLPIRRLVSRQAFLFQFLYSIK